jgi:flagellar hook-associated protein 3 FlgL
MTSLDGPSQLFLANVDRIESRLQNVSQQLSSGLRITQASDDPDEIAPLLQLRADLASNTQATSNLGMAQTDAQAADTALGSAIQLMDQASTLGAQGAGSTTAASTRQSLASQVESVLDQMVQISQTTVQGRFIFSGDADDAPAYQVDLSAPEGVDQLASSASTRQIEDPAGGSFAASLTAQEIFDSTNADGSTASGNVFTALNSLRLGLLNNDSGQITSAIALVASATDHLNVEESFYGNVEQRITAATNYAATNDTALQTQVGQIQDADAVSAAMELTQDNTQLQAAFEMQAKMPTSTLFTYLA